MLGDKLLEWDAHASRLEVLQCNGFWVTVNQSGKAGQPLKNNACLAMPWFRLREPGLPSDQILLGAPCVLQE